ncbi:S-adenosyl-L-methionine-dependent methyltransferase [Nemania sp. FL0916]|nr:S-adenosyl-L-methionine-dependent methyltransferase [Nemania sp. FL0916]
MMATNDDDPPAAVAAGASKITKAQDITQNDTAEAEAETEAVGPIKIKLSPVEQTMIVTLWTRAQDAESEKPVVGDVYARAILDRIATDSLRPNMLPSDRRYGAYTAVRTRQLDAWCRAFIDTHAKTNTPVAVLHLACGLDMRALRLRPSCGANVRWVDVDRPEVVSLRHRLVPDPTMGAPRGAGRADAEPWDYRLLAASVGADADVDAWAEAVPRDRPLLVVAEGLFPYLEPEEGAKLLCKLVDHAPAGSQIVLDIVGTIMTRYHDFIPLFRGTGVRMKWSVDDGEDIAALHPRLQLTDTVRFHDLLPGWFASGAPPCLGPLTPVFSLLPSWRRYGQMMRFEF